MQSKIVTEIWILTVLSAAALAAINWQPSIIFSIDIIFGVCYSCLGIIFIFHIKCNSKGGGLCEEDKEQFVI